VTGPAVAIVGAGPSGCFVAQALLKLRPDARITIFDALPVPYGLVRYGVAPDHQGTKAITRQFDRLFERQGVTFAGNARLGRDMALDDLRAAFDAVVLATGLHADRRLGVPGEDLAGVHGSGAVTRGWNGWPEAPVPVLGPRVVVVGAGNVALDVARLLAKAPGECAGSDLGCDPGAGVREITVVGRSPAGAAKFDAVMLREFGHLADCAVSVVGAQGEGPVVEALHALDGHAPAGAGKRLTFRFGLAPLGIEGAGRVERIVFDGLTIPCDSVVTAIGFQGEDQPAADAEGVIAPGLHAAGWRKRGPRGTIPENRADAQIVAARIAADLPATSAKPGLIPTGAVDFAGWKRIDAAETAAAPEGRVRAKITTLAGLLALAREGDPA
jgi:ferredoxin--NADP+ reductase